MDVQALAFVAAAAFAPMASAQDTYHLGSQDKVRIKVTEWRASAGELFEWTAVGGEYVVNAAGSLSLPLIGQVVAAGLSSEDLSREISGRLKARIGLISEPDTSVEIVQLRPFYIIGHVDRPGEYQFRTGMRVLQAVGIAGGYFRPRDGASMRLARDAITARGDLRVISLEIEALTARRARLLAELEQRDAPTFPPEWSARKDDAAIQQVIREEKLIFETRRNALDSQITALDQLKALLEKEIVALTGRLATLDRQLVLIKKEVQTVGSLVEKGLAVAPRLLSLERTSAELEGKRLELETAVLRAKQDVNKAGRDMSDLRDQRQAAVLLELRTTQGKLGELTQKLGTTERLVFEAEVTAPQVKENLAHAEANQPVYSIVRRVGDVMREVIATETTSLEPGDVVKVQLAEQTDLGTAGLRPPTHSASNARLTWPSGEPVQ